MTNYRDLSGNNPSGGVTFETQTNRSGAITTGGTAQVLAAANPYRSKVRIQNISAGDLWVSETGTAVVDGAGSNKIVAGGSYDVPSTAAVSIIGATTGQKFTATEERA